MSGRPNFRTRYEDLYGSGIEGNNEHQLLLVGSANDGPLNDVQSFVAGLPGLADAETLFGASTRLPQAIREAMNVALEYGKPLVVHAMRIAKNAAKASLSLNDFSMLPAIRMSARYEGTAGNDWQVKIEEDSNPIQGHPDFGKTFKVVNVRQGVESEGYQFEVDRTSVNAAGLLVEAINKAGLNIVAEVSGDGALPANIEWTPLIGGTDGALTYDALTGALNLLLDTDYPNLLVLGLKGAGDDSAPVVRDLLNAHCAASLMDYQQERIAFLDAVDFDSTAAEGSSPWLEAMDNWCENIENDVKNEDRKNLIIFAGSMKYTDAKGENYTAPCGAAAAARWLLENINKSMINLQLPGSKSELIPNFRASIADRLADARFNFPYYDKDRGIVLVNSRTLAADGSDFEDAEVIRTAYQCGSEARVGGKPFWGLPDDGKGSGLDALQAGMEKAVAPRIGKTVVACEVKPSMDSEGETFADMYITHYTTMKSVTHRVYRKRS